MTSVSSPDEALRRSPRARITLHHGVLLVALLGLSAWLYLRPAPSAGSTALELQGETMGTTFAVKVVAELPGEADPDLLRVEVLQILEEVDGAMSSYRPDSELSRFNAVATTAPVPVSPGLLAVMARAREVSERSRGAFDVTVAPLVEAWGFGATDAPASAPTAETLDSLRDRVGYRRVEVDPVAGTLRKSVAAVALDLSAIAKGYAVDLIARRLEALGHRSHLVEIGGEVRAAGHNARGDAWRIAIERPEAGVVGAAAATVSLRNLALATSGGYRNYRDLASGRVSHTIDPRTLRPTDSNAPDSGRPAPSPLLASVSVAHRECAMADAWATALTVLGPDEGWRVALAEGLAVLFILRGPGGELSLRPSPAFALLLAGAPASGGGEEAL